MTAMLMLDGNRRLVGDLASELARLESLLVDLERLADGQLPTARELDAAPLLSPFIVSSRPAVCLIGGNCGHPINQGHTIRTSDVAVLAAELGWARTSSRLYRLGEPFYPWQLHRILEGACP
jgi:hypothetical protein